MQTRTEIIVKGEVQRVGYRDEVEKIARKLNIKGFVENLKPYDVRIVCEGEEGDVKRFIGALRIEGDPLIRVSDIAVEYDRPTGEFEYFEIKRGSSEEETAERLDLAARHLKSLVSVVSGMNENIGGKIDAGREENREGFTTLGDKIDTIKGDTSAMLEKQDKTLEKQDRTIGILEDVREDMGEITNALTFLKEIYRETVELREKYELLSRDVEAIKMKMGV